MRIIHFLENMNRSGVENVVLGIVRGRAQSENEHIIYCRGRDGGMFAEFEKRGIHVEFCFKGRLFGLLFFIRYLREVRADLVHIHRAGSGIIPQLCALLCPKNKTVITNHSNYKFINEVRHKFFQLTRWSCLNSVAISSSVAEDMRRNKVVPRNGNLRVIPNGVDIDLFRCGVIKKNSQFRICCVGRLSEEKGFHVLPRIVRRLKNRGVDVSVTVAGEGPERKRLESLIVSHKVEEYISFVGVVDDMPNFFLMHDVFLHPAISEGFGIAVIEAMACGILVVASAVGGIPEIIKDGVNGYLIMPDDVEGISEKLIQVASMGEERKKRITREGRLRVEEEFSTEKMSQRYADLYQFLMKPSF